MRGKTGGSMGGRIVQARPTKFEFNESYCPECGAVKGQPCIKSGWENCGRGHRQETHRSEANRRDMELPFSPTNRRKIKRRAR